MHPKAIINEHYPHAPQTLRLKKLVVVRQAVKVVRNKECQYVWVLHELPSGEPVILHANLKWIVFPKLIYHPDNPALQFHRENPSFFDMPCESRKKRTSGRKGGSK